MDPQIVNGGLRKATRVCNGSKRHLKKSSLSLCRIELMQRPLGQSSGHEHLSHLVPRASASTSPSNDDSDATGAGQLRSESPEAAALQESREVSRELSQRSLWQKIKYSFTQGGKLDKKRLAELGAGAFASYSFVSNSTYGPGLAISWIAFMKKTGKTPLMANQWKIFLAFFGGFWTIQHFLRPLRFTLAIAMAPAFDKLLTMIQNVTGLQRRPAFAVYLFLYCIFNACLVFGSILLFGGPGAFARS